jgi:hypothetical protein
LLLMIHLLISCDIMGAGSAFSMSYIIEFGWPVAGEVIPMNCRLPWRAQTTQMFFESKQKNVALNRHRLGH